MSQPEPPGGEVQRWTAKRKAALVLDLVRGKITPADAARQHRLTAAEIEQWKEDFLAQGTEALRSHPISAGAPISPSSSAVRMGGARSSPSSIAAPVRCWATPPGYSGPTRITRNLQRGTEEDVEIYHLGQKVITHGSRLNSLGLSPYRR